jgi:hypothetical protein
MMNDYGFVHGPLAGVFGFGPYGSILGAGAFILVAVVILLWELVWKGLALWYSARNGQKAWFVVFLLVHTLGILEIVYLFGFRSDRATNPLFGKTSASPADSSSPSA